LLKARFYAADHAHKYQLFYQMTRVTRERGAIAKDDRLDSLGMAVAYWVEQMDKDQNKVQSEHHAKLQDEGLAKFATQVFGHTPVAMNWIGS
jgi:hypothetical protein